MRGPSKSLPKYRKHKRSGQAIVTLSGKDFYLGPHSTTASKLEYDRVIGEWVSQRSTTRHKRDGVHHGGTALSGILAVRQRVLRKKW